MLSLIEAPAKQARIRNTLYTGMMEFKQGEMVDREVEIAGLLLCDFTLNQMVEKTHLNKKILTAHLRNMMEKLQAADMDKLRQLLKEKVL